MSRISLTDRNERIYSHLSAGSSFPSLLTLLFIGLKLTGYIDWSWVWVLSPIWGCWLLALVVLIILANIEASR